MSFLLDLHTSRPRCPNVSCRQTTSCNIAGDFVSLDRRSFLRGREHERESVSMRVAWMASEFVRREVSHVSSCLVFPPFRQPHMKDPLGTETFASHADKTRCRTFSPKCADYNGMSAAHISKHFGFRTQMSLLFPAWTFFGICELRFVEIRRIRCVH